MTPVAPAGKEGRPSTGPVQATVANHEMRPAPRDGTPAHAPTASAPSVLESPGGPATTGGEPFRSLLFPGAADESREEVHEVPDFFRDLHLDRVVEAITAGRQEYDLVPFFHENLTDPDAVAYRQEVMRDMENGALRNAVSSFAERMRTRHRWSGLATRLRYPLERQRWHLASVEMYAEAVQGLSGDIATLDLASRGLRAFRAHLAAHAHSASFRTLVDEAREIADLYERIFAATAPEG